MIIKKVNLIDFGKFHNKIFDFADGVNIFYGDNETGKSTIHRFIEIMISSLNRLANNTTINDNDEVMDYLPWHNKSSFKGELIFEWNGNEYKAYRDFLDENQDVKLYLLSDFGRETLVTDYSVLQVNTLGIKNISYVSADELVDDIKDRIVNKSITNDEDIEFSKVIKDIKKRISYLNNAKDKQGINQIAYSGKVFDSLKQKELYVERESKKEQRVEKTKLLNQYEQQIIQSKKNKRYIEYYRLMELESTIDQLDQDIKLIEEFDKIDMEKFSKYLGMKSMIKNKTEELDQIISKIEYERGISDQLLNKYNTILLGKISDESYYTQFISEINQFKELDKENGEIKEEIRKLRDRMSVYDAAQYQGAMPYDLERDYHRVLHEENRLQIINNDNSYSQEIEANKVEAEKVLSKRSRFMVFIVLVAIIAATAFVGAYFLSELSPVLYGLGFVGFIGFVVLVVVLIQLSYTVDKLNHKRMFLERNQEERNNEYESIISEINLIYGKYECHNYDEFIAYYNDIKKAEKDMAVYNRDLSMFEKQMISIDNKRYTLNRHIELKIQQCNLSDEFSVETGDSLIEYLNTHRYILKKRKEDASIIDKLQLEYDKLKYQVSNLKKDIIHGNYDGYKHYSYEDILEKKQTLYELIQKRVYLSKEFDEINKHFTRDELLSYRMQPHKTKEELEEILSFQNDVDYISNNKQQVIDDLYSIKQEINDIGSELTAMDQTLIHQKVNELQYHIHNNKINKYNNEIDSLNKLVAILTEKSKTIQSEISKRLINTINNTIIKITGRYNKLILSDNMEIKLEDFNGNQCNIEDVSLGTFDQVYLSIRIGLIKVMNSQSDFVVVLDDAFVQYDIERFNAVMQIIKDLKEQVILFTCYDREKEYATQNHYDVNYMEIM